MAYDYTDLQKSSGTPGFSSIVYLIPVRWVESFGAMNHSNSPLQGASVIITEPHVPVDGKGFFQFYSTQSFSEFQGTSVGDEDSETMEFTLTLQHPGLKPAIAEFIKNARQEAFIAIVKSVDCADQSQIPWQFGTHCAPVKFSFEVTSGTSNSGSCAVKAIGKWFHPYPIFYSAEIPLLESSEEGE